MSLTADTSINFNSSVGYTFTAADVEFVNVGGQDVCRLKSSFTSGTSTVITPTVDPAAWTGEINSMTFGGNEAAVVASGALYYHRFFVSFDGGATYQTFIAGQWQDALPDTEGMSLTELQAVRVFPDLSELIAAGGTIRFKINITRAVSNAAAGYINQLTIYYGSEEMDFGGEPDGTDVLEPPTPMVSPQVFNSGIMPDFPFTGELILPARLQVGALGYTIAVATAQACRVSFGSLSWSGRFGSEVYDPADPLDQATIYGFLQTHYGNEAFIWTPPGFAASSKWICTQPKITRLAPNPDGDVWRVESSFLEVLP